MDTFPVVSVTANNLLALANMTGVGGVLNGAKVHLYQNNIAPQKTSVLADFVEATYTGYAAVAIATWGTPYIGLDGLAHVSAPSIQFQPTDAVTPNTIFGAYLTNAAGTVLIAAAQYVTPVPLPNASEAAIYEPDYIWGN